MLASTPVPCWLERQRRSAAGPTFFSMALGMVTEVIQVKQVTSLVHPKLKQIQSTLHILFQQGVNNKQVNQLRFAQPFVTLNKNGRGQSI